MNEEQKVTLDYLIDMYDGIFDDDIIQSVLEHRDWNTDRALDDLSIMAEGSSFEIPIDGLTAEPLTSNFHSGDPLSQQIQFGSYTNSNDNEIEDKAESEDDIIVVNEEEFCLTNGSESEDEKSSPERHETTQAPSYASIAKKPPTYEEISRTKPPSILFTGYTSFDRKKRTRDSLERVKLFVREGFKIMVILRGCAGSGKSTLAKNILADCNISKNPYWYIHSADNYFHLNDQGTYQHDQTKLDAAHKWNQVNVLHVIREGLTPIIIDNTNTRMWEMEVYAAMAVCGGYEIEVVEPDTPWAFHAPQLARKNTHRVDKERITMTLNRYEYNISSSLLMKSFNLEYAVGMAPPQVGVRELSNQELTSLFEDLYNAIHVFPQQLKALKKQQKPKKPSRKARKKARALEEKSLDDIVNAIENCGETTENGDESLDDIDVANQVVQSFASRDITEDTDSDKSWEDVTSDSYVSVLEESQNSSDESDDEDENNDETSDSESSSSSLESDEIPEEVDETVAAELAPVGNIDDASNDEKEENPESMNSVNTMVDSLRNPMGLGANEDSVEINDNTKNKFSNRLYDALSKNSARLKCFEKFHGSDELLNALMDEDIAYVSDPLIIQSVTKIIDEPPSPIEPCFARDTDEDSSDNLVQNILNNALPPIEKVPSISDIVAEVVNAPIDRSPTLELLENPFTDDLIKSVSSTINDTGFSEASEPAEWRRSDDTFSCIEGKIFDTSVPSAEPFTDVNDSLNSSSGIAEVTVIYNQPERTLDVKSNKSLKNLNAGNSTEDDRNSLLDEAKRITGSADADASISYKNNLNEGDDSPAENYDQVVSSSKFKDEADGSSSLIRSIENDLWGDSFEDNTHIADTDRNPGSENSENSDYGSNSSSSDELRMEDIHNSVNRFVNNDIKSDQSSEKKKRNINLLKDKNGVDDEGISWNVDSTVELNTLKERILVNSLDKVFNQARNAEDDADSEIKTTNLSRKSSVTGFQMIENKLNEKFEVNVERKDLFDEYAPRDETEHLDTDRAESKFWNQWMKGDSWDDAKEDKDAKSTDVKPPRKHDSPTKQKNTETSSIRLVNDIKTSADKNTNQGTKMKTINFEPMMTDYFKNRSYPNAEDSLFGLPAAYDAKLKNVNVHDSKDSYYAMNTTPKRVNDESSDDGEKKHTWAFPDNTDYDASASSYVDARRSPYRNFPKNYDIDLQFLEKQDKEWASSDRNTKNDEQLVSEPKPNRRNVKKKVEDKTPEFVDELVQRWKSIAKEESSPDYDKVIKWSPLNDNTEVEWNSDDNRFVPKAANCERKPQRALGVTKSKFCIPHEAISKCDQTTNTGTDDVTQDEQYRVAYCREINDDRESPIVCAIEQKMRCDKSTMTEGSTYTVKAKPIKEDLLNMFPKDMADSILDLYEKCNGNMDWIIEILLEDGYSPTDDQLEYLSSLQNVVNFENDVAKEKDKPMSEKKKKSNGNGKNIRRNNSHFEDNKEAPDSAKKIKRKRIDLRDEKQLSPDHEYPANLFNGEVNDEETEGCVELFLDTTTVQQLVGYFGNPTVYSLKDCQPVINLPVSLARQIHAYLLESVIDQAEKNESLVNQLAEEEMIAGQILNIEQAAEVTQNDMIDVENSLSDVINSEAAPSATSEDSFASKLSLDLLLKSFPTVDPSFVVNTFRCNKCNYYETKKILNQIRQEVATNLTFNLNDERRLLDQIRTEDEPLFDNTSMPRHEVLEQVNSYRDDAAFNYEQWQKFNEQLKTAIQRKRYGVAPYYRELMGAFKQKHDQCNAKAAAVLINSCCFSNSNVIDLHFFKVTEALRALDIFLDHHIARLANAARPKTTLYIITGRGARNGDGVSHLQPPIKARLKKRNIEFEVQPSNTGLVIAVVRKSSLLTHDL